MDVREYQLLDDFSDAECMEILNRAKRASSKTPPQKKSNNLALIDIVKPSKKTKFYAKTAAKPQARRIRRYRKVI